MACCGNSNVDNNDIKTVGFIGLGHLKGADKLAVIVKIQAAFRGFMGRKRVNNLRNYGG